MSFMVFRPRVSGSSGERFAADDENFGVDTVDPEVLKSNLDAFYRGEKVGPYIGVEFGMHESYSHYVESCLHTERNQGLYTADRNLGGTRARYTRQNQGGTRRGFECAEGNPIVPSPSPSPVAIPVAILAQF